MSDLSLDMMATEYFDVLKEIGNVGAGNATTALAQMLGSKVDMQVPMVRFLDFKDVGEMVGGEELIMAGIYLAVEGDISGSMMYLMSLDAAKVMVGKLMGMPVEGDEFGDIERSAVQEVGNIITGAYLNSLSTMTNLKIYPSPPHLAIDMAAAILSVPAIEFGMMGDKILLIETQFNDDVEIDGYFILIPDLESYDTILTSLGIIVNP